MMSREPIGDRPIRLMFVAESLRGRGTERAVVRLLHAFDRRLVQPELALLTATGEFLADVPPDVPLHDLAMAGTKTSSSAVRIFRLISTRDPECVVGVHTSVARLVALLMSVRRRTRVVCYETDLFSKVEARKGRPRLRQLATAVSHRVAARVVAASDDVASDLRMLLRLPPHKIEVIPLPCVDGSLDRLAAVPVDHPAFDGSTPVILNIGNMYEHKAQDVLLRGFAALLDRRRANLVIIGEGPMRPSLERLSESLGISSSVYFLGFQDNPFRYLARSDVFVSSSLFEGFDISQVEAMACGVPVVVTDVPRYGAVRDHESGLVVPPRDPARLAAAIDEILTNPELAASLAGVARRVASSLSAGSIARRYEDVLLSVVGRSRSRDPAMLPSEGPAS